MARQAPDPSTTATVRRARVAPGRLDWREHQRWVDRRGTLANVIELGAGPPAVRPRTLRLLAELAGEHPVLRSRAPRLAVDLPGFGASPMPARADLDRRYARPLDALMDMLGIERGGSSATRWAATSQPR